MNCNCIEEIDEGLAKHNLKLGCIAISFKRGLLIQLDTEWIDKSKAPRGSKNNPTPMIASHCPFCGASAEASDTDTKGENNA